MKYLLMIVCGTHSNEMGGGLGSSAIASLETEVVAVGLSRREAQLIPYLPRRNRCPITTHV